MKFLYIIDEFPPVGSHPGIRALEFSKRLLKKGISPIILTKKERKYDISNNTLNKEIPLNLKVIKSFSYKIRNKNFKQESS